MQSGTDGILFIFHDSRIVTVKLNRQRHFFCQLVFIAVYKHVLQLILKYASNDAPSQRKCTCKCMFECAFLDQ